MSKTNSNFFDCVYSLIRQIPYGKVCTYGMIAKLCGSPQSARMVGFAVNKSSTQDDYVPAHRVVNRNGLLTGKHHFGNQNEMKELLENEGITVENDKIQNFEKHLWFPKNF
ncbi:MAG: MGMT family protein [Bacteroidota bacterium]|nr:MGMT family protein [Bacteroidota bacterium]